MNKVYISVPYTCENYNDQNNYAYMTAVDLGMKGYDSASLFDLDLPKHYQYKDTLPERIKLLLQCDSIYLCKGWESSQECNAELQVALIYGKKIMVE